MKPDKKARAVRVPRSKGSSSGGSAGSNAKGRRATRSALQHEPANGFEALVTEHFDEAWYRSAYPEAARRIDGGAFRSGLEHYVRTGHREGNSPNADFDEAWYMSTYPDVASAVSRGGLHCGFHHYLVWGAEEERLQRAPAEVVCTLDVIHGDEVHGWAANMTCPTEHVDLVFLISGRPAGRVRADRPRDDLGNIFSTIDHGFSFRVPHAYCDGTPRTLSVEDARGRRLVLKESTTGLAVPQVSFQHCYDQIVSVALGVDDKLAELSRKLDALRDDIAFVRRMTSLPLFDYRHYYHRFYRLTVRELATMRARAAELAYQPLISIVLPVYDTKPRYLDAAIRSVIDQVYPHWRLCIADDASSEEGLREIIREHATREPRIEYKFGRRNVGLAANTNRALEIATGEYVTFLDHDDTLAPDALYCVALALQKRRWKILYSDEDIVDPSGEPLRPHLKPDFDYDYFLAVNYLCHLFVVQKGILDQIGGARKDYEGCQDRDLALRALEACGESEVFHIPRILYHWRENPESVSQTAANRDLIVKRSVACVQEHLDRLHEPAVAHASIPSLFSCRVSFRIPSPSPKVSIIIPSKDRIDLLGPCLSSIIERTRYDNYNVVIVSHDGKEKGTHAYLDLACRDRRVQVVEYSGAFNWSALNNFGASRADGTILCFLNDDMLAIDEDWLTEIVGHALRPDVGAVGAKLLYEDGSVQHAGVVLGISGYAGHAFKHIAASEAGYLGRAGCTQTVSAVTGACLACRRSVFEEVAGFNIADFPVSLNDVDFCLRIQERGYRIVFTPHAVLYHYESKSRGYDVADPETRARLATDVDRLQKRWGHWLRRDPYYNPHFDLDAPPYERLAIPERVWTAEQVDALVEPRSNVRSLRGIEAPRDPATRRRVEAIGASPVPVAADASAKARRRARSAP